jgi:hypothetical protein
VIVDDLDVARRAVVPPEDHSPLVIDSNRTEALPRSLQRLQPISRRYTHILQPAGSMQVLELARRCSSEVGSKLSSGGGMSIIEQVVGELVSERPDHVV